MTDIGSGIRYCAVYTARIVLVVMLMTVLGMVLLGQFRDGIPDTRVSGIGMILGDVASYALPFLPLIPLSFTAGCMEPGSRRRMILRLIMNVYLAIVILFFVSDADFVMYDVMMHADPEVTAREISMTIDYGLISTVMLCIPMCSGIDAVVEYVRRHRIPSG